MPRTAIRCKSFGDKSPKWKRVFWSFEVGENRGFANQDVTRARDGARERGAWHRDLRREDVEEAATRRLQEGRNAGRVFARRHSLVTDERQAGDHGWCV